MNYILDILMVICERTYDYTTIILRYYGYSLILTPIGTLIGMLTCIWLAVTFHWYFHLIIWIFLIGLCLHIAWPWMRNWNRNAVSIMKELSEEWGDI